MFRIRFILIRMRIRIRGNFNSVNLVFASFVKFIIYKNYKYLQYIPKFNQKKDPGRAKNWRKPHEKKSFKILFPWGKKNFFFRSLNIFFFITLLRRNILYNFAQKYHNYIVNKVYMKKTLQKLNTENRVVTLDPDPYQNETDPQHWLPDT